MRKLLLSFCCVLLFGNSFAQNYEWAKGIEGAGKSRSIAVDSTGNVYIKGTFIGTCDFDPSPATVNITAVSSADIYFAKYDANGNYIWAKNIGAGISDNTDNAGNNYIAVDGAGNVFITGHFTVTADFDPDTGTANLTPVGGSDIFFAKYDANGDYIWAKSIGSTVNDNGVAIVVDTAGNVLIAGSFSDTADFNPGPDTANLTPLSDVGIFFAKYDSSGNYLWAKSIGGYANFAQPGPRFVLDGAGNVHITGHLTGTTDFDPDTGTANLTSGGVEDIFFAKYDVNGNYLWAKSIGSTGVDLGVAIAVDGAGNVHIAGQFTSTVDFNPGLGIDTLTSVASSNAFFAKYDANGDYIWAKSIEGSSDNGSNSIALDGAGNMYIYGSLGGTADFDPDTGVADTANLTSAGGWDIYFAKYDANGNYIWAKNIGSSSNEAPVNMTLDALANIYITGYYTGSTVDFDPGPDTANLIAVAGDNIFFAKYNQPIPPPPLPPSPQPPARLAQRLQ